MEIDMKANIRVVNLMEKVDINGMVVDIMRDNSEMV
jgi:hypothetical protein